MSALKSSDVDKFIKNEKKWKAEVALLREIALDCKLDENFKWRFPCYSLNDKNVIIIQTFKEYCALMFFHGDHIKDAKKLLIQPGPNSQSARRLEFRSPAEVTKLEATIKKYIKEAMAAEKNGIKEKPSSRPDMPEEMTEIFKKDKKLKEAFLALTPGRQRHYIIHISSAKQSATRTARIQKNAPRILKGLGLND